MAAFRMLLVVLLALVLVALGASLSQHVGGGAISLSLWVPLVVWLGLEAGLVEGAAAAAAVGVVADAAAGGPMGLHTFLCVACFLASRAAAPTLGSRGAVGFAALAFAGTVLVGLGALVLTRYVSAPEAAPRWGLMGRVAVEALLVGALAPAVRWAAGRVVGSLRREESGLP
jgi:hypothetical protein